MSHILVKHQLLQCKQFYQCITQNEISFPVLFAQLKQDRLPAHNPALKEQIERGSAKEPY